MNSTILAGSLLAVLSGLMNGSFTFPMRFLGCWEWENVWSLFIVFSCVLLPTAVISLVAPHSWVIIARAPVPALIIAVLTGFTWGFGAILFGQSVSAIGISLANTLVLAISSGLGSLLPIVLMSPRKLLEPAGEKILASVMVEVAGVALCGWAGRLREQNAGAEATCGEMVGQSRPLKVALLMACGAGVLSAVFNIGFAFAQPIADCGRADGLGQFAATSLIWGIMLGAGAVSNLAFCLYLLYKHGSLRKFRQPGAARLFSFSLLMALLWGGSIFVYGASAPRLGSLGVSIGWPLSLAVGLLVANSIGIGMGEWRLAPPLARLWMYTGIAVLLVAVVLLGNATV